MISAEILSKNDLPAGVTTLPPTTFSTYPASSNWCSAFLTIAPLPFLNTSGVTPRSFLPTVESS